MRSRRLALLAASALLGACASDIFHATDWSSACERDLEAEGCPGAVDPGATVTSSSAGGAGGRGGAGGEGGAGGGAGGSGGTGGAGGAGGG